MWHLCIANQGAHVGLQHTHFHLVSSLTGEVRASLCEVLLAFPLQALPIIGARASPKRERDRHGIEMDSGPPRRLIAVPMQFAMVEAADRNGKLVADLSS